MQLGTDQQKAIDLILEFLKSSDVCFSLVGAAGTGKSYTISQLLPKIDELNMSIVLCAPTHKASIVMMNYCGRSAITIHSLLALTPNLYIEKFNLLDLKFLSTKDNLQIPYKGVVICDEASMINDDLFDLLIEKCKDYKCKIIFVSDKAQLFPVDTVRFSKVYTNCDKTYTLTKIYRQSDENCILPILTKLRTEEIRNFKPLHSSDGDLNVYTDIKEFVRKCAADYKQAISNKDILYTKMLVYTNKAVRNYNKAIQRFIWKDKDLFHVGDILTAYANGRSGVQLTSNGEETISYFDYYNGMDYFITNVCAGYKRLPCYGDVDGYWLTLYDNYNKSYGLIFLLTDVSKYPDLPEKIEDLRLRALKTNKWQSYMALTKSFCSYDNLIYEDRVVFKKTFDLGYSCTIHRAQGSSYNKVYIDLSNLKKCCKSAVRRQLEYVAFSRTRSDVNIFNK